ncbi:MAG: sensor domain-containing diguanylate cyclase [Chloroflexi bacterium]|nr:sensor domain-containing diguanylate cyclase [Chloroflexota bacterium]
MSIADDPDEQKKYLNTALQLIDEGVFIVDKRGILSYSNQAAARLASSTGTLLGGRPFFDQCKPSVAEKTHAIFHRIGDRLEKPISEIGRIDELHYELKCRATLDDEGRFAGIACAIRDISGRQRFSKMVKHIATTDSLTRLFNRRHFHIKLRDEARRARRQGYPLSLVILDLDDFKEINKGHGHLTGDGILRSIGDIIARNIRQGVDSAFRYGGDEFTIILPEAGLDQAAAVARRIREDIARNTDPRVTASGGVAELCGRDPETLINVADRALYRAKNLGGDLIFVEHERQEA